MLIISHDRLTIIDTDNGASFTAEEPYPGMGYTIFANYQTCGKRVLCPDIDMELAKGLMKNLFNELSQNKPRMLWNHTTPFDSGNKSNDEKNQDRGNEEWKQDDEGRTVCPSCGETFHPWMSGFSFCPKCGSRNRKEGEICHTS